MNYMKVKYLSAVLGKYLIAILVCFCIIAIIGYIWHTKQSEQPEENIVRGTGTVVWLDLEGGFWGIVGDDGNRYDPINLDPEFRSKGLRISFEAKIREDVLSIHMWGKTVEILHIQKLG